jgi:hypothetical protein
VNTDAVEDSDEEVRVAETVESATTVAVTVDPGTVSEEITAVESVESATVVVVASTAVPEQQAQVSERFVHAIGRYDKIISSIYNLRRGIRT